MTPWDLGQPTPAVVELAKSGTLPGDAATVLVPGCGAVSDPSTSVHARACIGRTLHHGILPCFDVDSIRAGVRRGGALRPRPLRRRP